MLRLRSQKACRSLGSSCLAHAEAASTSSASASLSTSAFTTSSSAGGGHGGSGATAGAGQRPAALSLTPPRTSSAWTPTRRELFGHAIVVPSGVAGGGGGFAAPGQGQCREYSSLLARGQHRDYSGFLTQHQHPSAAASSTRHYSKKSGKKDKDDTDNDDTNDASAAARREATQARIQQRIDKIDVASVYGKAKTILAPTKFAVGEGPKAPPAEDADEGGEMEGRSTVSKNLLKKLQDHVKVLEEFLKLEQERDRLERKKLRRQGAAPVPAPTVAPSAESAAVLEGAAVEDGAAESGEAAETLEAASAETVAAETPQTDATAPATPESQPAVAKRPKKPVTWDDVMHMRNAIKSLQTESAKAKKKASGADGKEKILSITQNVLKEQNISLQKSDRKKGKDDRKKRGASGKDKGAAGGEAPPEPWRPTQEVQSIRSRDVRMVAVDVNETRTAPPLSYDLDRVLFNPGVYQLQDLRSKVYNFDPYLANIMPIAEFDYNALKGYTTSSKDNKLISIAAQHGRKYCGSTSSMTSVLAHFHYLLSDWRPLGFGRLSKGFEPDSKNFTEITRSPAATFLRWRNGVYAIDSDKEFDTATILSMLGRSLEKLLTLPQDEYEKYRRSRSMELTEEERNADEVYHYSTLGDFMMRSQLDAYDKRLPGEGVFDLKTRAVVTVRMDAQRFEDRRDYEIKRRHGEYESFEREYYDLIRSAFLKYSLQVRMGRMDGIFLAYHNTQRIFGFQYVPLEEMDEAMHGTSNKILGDAEFRLSLQLWNELLKKIMAKFHGRSVRLHVETRAAEKSFMYVFAKPVTEEEVSAIQDANARSVTEMENKILGITRNEVEELEQESEEVVAAAEGGSGGETAEAAAPTVTATPTLSPEEAAEDAAENARYEGMGQQDVWDAITRRVEESMEDEEFGVERVRGAIRAALDRSGLMKDARGDEVETYVESLLGILTREGEGENTSAAEGEGEGESEAEGESAAAEEGENEIDSESDSDEASDGEASPGATLRRLIMQHVKAQEAATPSTTTEPIDARLADFGRILSGLVGETASAAGEGEAAAAATTTTGEMTPSEASDGETTTIPTNADALATSSPSEAPTTTTISDDELAEAANPELIGFAVTIRNKVDGAYVRRVHVDPHQTTLDWTLEYVIKEMDPTRAHVLYRGLLDRRRKALVDEEKEQGKSERSVKFSQKFQRKMDELSKDGKRFRAREDRFNKKRPVHVVGEQGARSWESVFGGSKE